MSDDWYAITDLSREKRIGEEDSLWTSRHPRRSEDSLPQSHCAKCGFAIDVTRVGSTLAYFEPKSTELHSCAIKPRFNFDRVKPKPKLSLKIGGKRVDV